MKNLYASLVLSSAIALFAMPDTSHAGTYGVDTSFANSGSFAILLSGSDFRTLAHLVRPDGSSIAIATYDNNGCPAGRHCFVLYPFTAAGQPQAAILVPTSMSFSKRTGGIVLDPYLVKAAAIDSQNRIVIAGTEQLGPVLQFKVIRLLPNGQPDTSFDGDGIATPGDFSGRHEAIAEAMAIDGSDRIIVAGRANLSATDSDFAILRLTSAGALDTSFNTTGKKTIFFDLAGPGVDGATAVALRPGGQIYLAGYASDGGVTRIALAKLLPFGTLDGNFCPTTCTYQGPYTNVNSGKRVLFYGDVADNQSDYVKSADVNVSGEMVYAGLHEAGPGDFRVFAQKVALNGDYANEGEVHPDLPGSQTYYVGGIRYFNPNSGISDLVLTGSTGANGQYFFAQGLNGALVPIVNWGAIGENNSVLLYAGSGGSADFPGDLPAIPSVDDQARVLVGGSFKATPSDPNYSMTVARLAGDVIFRNGFE